MIALVFTFSIPTATAVIADIQINETYTIAADSNYTTYFGSTGAEDATKIAFDREGNTLLIGQSQSDDMPTTTGVIQETRSGGDEPFIAKFSPAGDLIFCTYLGGSSYEHITSVNTDSDNNILVSGHTQSTNFPVSVDAYQGAFGGGGDGFIAKISPDGSELIYSTYFGGTSEEWIYGMEVDASDNYLFSGFTSSDGLATAGAYQTTRGGLQDAFVAKLSANGASLNFLSYFGGSGGDRAWTMTVDGSYNFVISGVTQSSDLPGVAGSFQETYGGGTDGYIAKISSSGASLIFASYYGGDDEDMGLGVDVDSEGNIILGGCVQSENIPTLNAMNTSYNGGAYDIFAAKFDSTGTAIFSTYLGGEQTDRSWDLRVDNNDDIILVGRSISSNYPTTVDAIQPEKRNNYDVVVTKIASDGQSIIKSTFFGGRSEDIGEGIAVDGEGRVVISGRTSSSDLNITDGAYQPAKAGLADVFVCHTAFDTPIGSINTEPTSTPTTSLTDIPLDPTVLLLAGVGAAAVIIVILIVMKKK